MKPQHRFSSPLVRKNSCTSNSSDLAGQLAVAVLFALGAGHSLQAQTNWDGGPLGTGVEIGTAANWAGDVLPSANGGTAQWNGTVAGNLSLNYAGGLGGAAGNTGLNFSLTAAQSGSVAIDSGLSTGSIRLNGITIAAGAGALTLGNAANTFSVTLGGATGTSTWTNNSSSTATIASDVVYGVGGAGARLLVFDGSGNWVANNNMNPTNAPATVAVTKTGGGTLTVGGANTYTGATIVANGELALSTGNNRLPVGTVLTLGSATGDTSGVLRLNSRSQQVGGLLTAGAGTGNRVINGNATLATFTVSTGAGTTTYGGKLGGPGTNENNLAFTKAGAGTLILSSTNTHTGTNSIGVNGTGTRIGVVRATANQALGTGPLEIGLGGNDATARLELSGGISLANNALIPGRNNTTAAIENVAGNNSFGGTVTITSGGTDYRILSTADKLTFTGATSFTANAAGTRNLTFQGNGNTDVNGVIENGVATVNLVKAGNGRLTLNAANTYSGTTNVQAGSLHLGSLTGSLNAATALTLGSSTTLGLSSTAATRNQQVASLGMTDASIELALAGNTADKLSVTGAATLAGTNTVKISGFSEPGVYNLLTTGAALAGTINLDSSAMPTGFVTYGGAISGNDYVLTVSGTATPGSAWWKGDVSGTWTDASLAPDSNWTSDAAGTIDTAQLPGSTTDVIFAATGSANNATTLGSDVRVKSLSFEAGTYSVGGPDKLSIVGANANLNALEVGSGATVTLSTGESAWAGRTTVAAGGTLAVGASTALGNADAALDVLGTLRLDADVTKGDLSGNGIVTSGTVDPRALGVQSVLGSEFSGTFQDGSGPLGFVKSGAGVLTLTGSSTHSGTTTVAAGELSVGAGLAAGSLGSGPISISAGGTLRWNRADDIGIANNITGAGAQMIKDGTGVLTLGGVNNFATAAGSGFVIANGRVVLGSATAVPSGIVFGVNNGTLDLNGVAVTTGWLNGLATGVITDDSATPGTTQLTLGGTGAPDYAGAIDDGANGRVLAVAKTGSGNQILSGSSDYSGGTIISQGLLTVNSSTAVGGGAINLPGSNSVITRLQLGNGVSLANNIEVGTPNWTDFNGSIRVPGANDSATIAGTVLVKQSGLVGGTLNGGSLYGPTGTGVLTLSGAVNTDAPGTQVLIRGGNVRFGQAGSAVDLRNEGNISIGANNAINPSAVLSMAASNAAGFDLNGFNQSLAGIGSHTTINNLANVTNSSPTPATLSLVTDPAVDYATASTAMPIGSLGINVLDANTTLTGALNLDKLGLGTLTLQGPSTFTGDVDVSAGLLIADRGNNVNDPVNSALGNPLVARQITVGNGATLRFAQGDTLGSATTVVAAMLVIEEGGTVVNNGNNFNTLGPVQLNGGTLATTGGAIGGYQSYHLSGTVTVGGSSPSDIALSGPGNAFNGVHLGANTTFTVADASGDSAADLVVSIPLVDRHATVGGAGGLTKSGVGTMSLTAPSSYTGNTAVTGGKLVVANDDVFADSSTIELASMSSLELTHGGVDTVTALIVGGVPQSNGLYTFGSGQLKVGLSTPFEDWALLKGLDGTPGKEDGPTDDPDGDGAANLIEFAFNGDPLSGADNGRIHHFTEDSSDVPSGKDLVLTFAVRSGAPVFSGSPSPTSTIDGITYSVQGSTDLSAFTSGVSVVDPVVGGLDPAGAGYEYRSFILDGSDTLPGKGFLRATVIEAP
jgi:autotransporter-associated beta strand protein